MTSFINDSGEIVISEDITFTKQVASFFSFQVKGDFSVNFKIPNTSENRAVLGIYGLNQISPDVKQEFRLHIKGNEVQRGNIIIQKINSDFIELFFTGGNSNWINNIIEETADLRMNQYVSWWDETNIMTTSIANDSGIVYPLCDWAYNFKKTTSGFTTQPIVDAGGNEFFDFYPCFYLKDLVKEIVQQSGFKLAGNILDDGIYNKQIITPANGQIKRNPSFVNERTAFANKTSAQTLGSVNTYYKITFDDVIRSTSLFSSSTYTGDTYFTCDFKLHINTSVGQEYTVALYVDGVSSATSIFTGTEADIDFSETFLVVPDRYYEIYIKVNSGGASADVNAETTIEIVPNHSDEVHRRFEIRCNVLWCLCLL